MNTVTINLNSLNGLKIALCQMPVVPGRPDVNADYMVGEIEQAAAQGNDIIVFPEMCVSGYLIGDKFEDDSFVRDVLAHNERVCDATSRGITAVFGSIDADFGAKGEDGRIRKHNAGFVAKDGRWMHRTHKFLQPNYRIFDDDRHFFSKRKELGEATENTRLLNDADGYLPHSTDFFAPLHLETRLGIICVGVILCEDMWHNDYAYNPTRYLVEQGAQIIFNLSASPWSWQKNRKRHQVVHDLLKENPAWFVYVNNTEPQNNGKNIVVFDGSSAAYRPDGNVVFEVGPYERGTRNFTVSKTAPPSPSRPQDDTAELHDALASGADWFFRTFPPDRRKVVVGLSGGIDSSVVAAFCANRLGPENVYGISMPFHREGYTSGQSQVLAEDLAKNLGIRLDVIPINDIVEAICGSTGVEPETPDYANAQAEARMLVLSRFAQKHNGVFTVNANKVETAFGYGTLNGDMRGAFAILGDLVKREVYQEGEYLNRVVYGREVIPRQCFERKPTAEIEKNQFDPFDYGNLAGRGYHDEMVRAFTEFRKNPEWFVCLYLEGGLEQELRIPRGRLTKLFMNGKSFVADLEEKWRMFHWAYFKRVQACPIIIVSKRAFGFDLRESMLSAHFTRRYQELKHVIEAER